ncbi:MAG TPA: STAS domain-containing protein [Candidatus Hydrogenedentes bacterium]|nr:STAS domain-containing protein [Candidatus Hydrogenedentota bacterium]HQE82307.1 STAS domain-containing protein [Candidatus Hydrogenedentota bacterium]HQH69215.1 STAS domain-containing protein [Candidatus Hydrogenedentota bacterium]HQM48997.1 STAS domain-containing protein [Candidatus Hydrogenedentota bacterium]
MKTEVETRNHMCVVKVAGEVDLYSSPELRKAITKAVPAAEALAAVDLSGVTYMDSSGVATLVEGLRESDKKGIAFALVAPSQPVLKVLSLSRLDKVFDIRENLDEASGV